MSTNNRVKELSNRLADSIQTESMRLLKSGGINAPDYDDDYALAKVLVYAAIHSTIFQLRPLDAKHLSDAHNLMQM